MRRLFLSSYLAIFYPGSLQQHLVGLMGAMFSYTVYSFFDAYVDDNDDYVATFASIQLVLTYFGTLSVYASDAADEKDGFFSNLAFGIILVVIFFLAFVVGVVVTLIDIFGRERFYEILNHIAAGCMACIRCEPCRRTCWRGNEWRPSRQPTSDNAEASTTHPTDGENEQELPHVFDTQQVPGTNSVPVSRDNSSTTAEDNG